LADVADPKTKYKAHAGLQLKLEQGFTRKYN